MQKSESIKNVMTALGQFQAKEVKIRKDSTNPHFKSKYASLSVILDEIQPILTECKLVFTQVPEESTHLVTLLFHTESGEFIECRYDLKAVQTTPQGIGSAITYARRYSLTSILGLNIDDDDDGNAASTPAKEQAPKQSQQQPAQQNQQPAQQPATPAATPFNKKYTESAPIIALVPTTKTGAELTELYKANKELVDGNADLKARFKEQELYIKNGFKKAPTEKQYGDIIGRIRKGELTVLENANNAFLFTSAQKEELQQLHSVIANLDEALKLKYTKAEDIATIIDVCYTEDQIMRLHRNNSMIIDRDPDLTNKINGKLGILKKAA